MSDIEEQPRVRRVFIARTPEEPTTIPLWVRVQFAGLTVFGTTHPDGFAVAREELLAKLARKSSTAAKWVESKDDTLDFIFTPHDAEDTTSLGR